MRPHNQRFYYNVFLRGFEPIYYDGNILIKNKVQMKYATPKDIEKIFLYSNLKLLQSFKKKIEGIDFWDKLERNLLKGQYTQKIIRLETFQHIKHTF